MTDRLRELAEQAGMNIRVYAEHYPAMGAQLYKFAALVRRDALKQAAAIVEREAFPSERARFGVAADKIRDLAAQCKDGS